MFTKRSYFLLFLIIFGLSMSPLLAKDRRERAREFKERVRNEKKHEAYREKKLRALDQKKATEQENIDRKYEKRMQALEQRKEYLGEENYDRQREKIEADKQRDMKRLESHYAKRREHVEEHGPAGRLKEEVDKAEEENPVAVEELLDDL